MDLYDPGVLDYVNFPAILPVLLEFKRGATNLLLSDFDCGQGLVIVLP